ncbi:MAG: glycoside hydrolase family 16 protein [Clostridiales bacterium]|nr:glycoside hydrolase family 16 protein [Clostridiales bacterium]
MKEDYRLVWADEFAAEGRPDADKWSFEVGAHWHNREIQAYTDRPENAFVRDGRLHIRALKAPYEDREFTSARMVTYPHAAWQYGYFEVRAKIPDAAGSWPAIWLMPVSSRQGVRWPLCGEIDMMEHTMLNPDTLVYSLHSEALNHMRPPDRQRSVSVYCPGATRDFHVFGLEWTRDAVSYLLDGNEVCRYPRNGAGDPETWPFDQPFFLILNVAVGGFMGGPVREADFPCEMAVDYVRVYQKPGEK